MTETNSPLVLPEPNAKGLVRQIIQIFKESVSSWIGHKAPKMGAALAYYTAFSLAPVVILILSVVSLFMKRHDAAQKIVAQISDLVGADGGKVVQEILAHSGSTNALSWSTVMSFLLLLWLSASGAFGELQDSLNTIWEVPKKGTSGWLIMLKNRLMSFSMVAVLGFFMLTSLVLSTFLQSLSDLWGSTWPKALLEGFNFVLSVAIITGLFGAVYKMLPDVKLVWSDVLHGAFFTALLFILGKFLLGFYIAHSSFASTYGAAASFVVILVWVFYSAQIIYFGAELTRSYSIRFGSRQT